MESKIEEISPVDARDKTKAAFMLLLEDFRNGVAKAEMLYLPHDAFSMYCKFFCPFKDNCLVLAADDEHYLDVDCNEEIFKGYLKRATDSTND